MSSGPTWKLDPRNNLQYWFDQRTNEYVYSNGARIRAGTAAPANTPRSAPSVTGQVTAIPGSPQPYNQLSQYQTFPPQAKAPIQVGGPTVPAVTQQLRKTNLNASTNTTAAGRTGVGQPIDGADVVRNPPLQAVQGQQPRRVAFAPAIQQRLLDSAYKVRDQARKFFTPGKVFLTLWTEPHSVSSVATRNPDVFAVKFGQHAFCRIRRFVVIRSGDQSCTALAISTHSGRGALGQNNLREHGVIYAGKSQPALSKKETGMQPTAIQVNTDEANTALDETSRINYGKVYTIEHNIKVKAFGVVNKNSMQALISQFSAVFSSTIGATAAGPGAAAQLRTLNQPNPGYLTSAQQDGIARHGGGAHAPQPNTNSVVGGRQLTGHGGQEGDSDDDERRGDDENSEDDEDEESDEDDDDEEDVSKGKKAQLVRGAAKATSTRKVKKTNEADDEDEEDSDEDEDDDSDEDEDDEEEEEDDDDDDDDEDEDSDDDTKKKRPSQSPAVIKRRA